MDRSVEEYVETVATAHAVNGHTTLPDGTVVYSAYRDGSYDLHTPDGQLTDVDADLSSPEWLSGRETVLAVGEMDGSEQGDLVEVDPETGAVSTLMADEFFYRFPRQSPTDPDRVAVISNRDRSIDLYTIDLTEGTVEQHTATEMALRGYAWAPDGRRIAYQNGAIDESTLRVVDLKDGTDERLVEKSDSEQSFAFFDGGAGAWSEDGVVFTTNHETGFRELAVRRPDGGYEAVFENERDKYDPRWLGDGIAFVETRGGDRLLRRYDDGEVVTVERTGLNTAVTDADGALQYEHADATTAGDLHRDGTRVIEEGGVDVPVTTPEEVSYTAPDGREIAARLYEPDGDPVAGVVQVHGGPANQQFNELDPLTQALVHNGFTVLGPDYRGSTGYGRTFRKLSDGDLGGDDLADVVAGAEYLREAGHDAVGVTGNSYGGYLTLMGVGATDAFDAGASVCGVVNWQTAVENSFGYLGDYLVRKLGGSYEERPDLYERRSPIEYTDQIGVPLLVVQGANDPRVPQSEAEQLVSSMEERSTPHEYILFEDEGHSIVRTENRVQHVSRAVAFFDSHLTG